MRFSSFSIILSLGIQARENTQSYQIRSKVGLREDGGNFFRRNDWESDVEDEIEELFCDDERLKIEGAQKCKLKDTGKKATFYKMFTCFVDFDYVDSGYVKFLIEVEMPESASKSDLKSHYEDKIVTTEPATTTSTTTTTNASTSSTTPPTQDTTTANDETTIATTETSTQTSTTTARTTTTHKEETTTTTATTTTTTTATTTTVETAKSTTTTSTTTASTTTTSEGSGDASGESSGEIDSLELIEVFVDFDDGSGIVPEKTYKFIDVTSLQPQSFVICVDECEDEGYWMLIGEAFFTIQFHIRHNLGFISISGFCLLVSGIGFACSKRTRNFILAVSSALLLGYIGGLIYVGVVEKVDWTLTGGFLGTVTY